MSAGSVVGGRLARIGIVGAGIAGLACARTLTERGLRVRLFEKESCPGGRIATRRLETLSFDYGVQYFLAQDSGFEPVVRQWEAAGLVAAWNARTVALAGRGPGELIDSAPRFVGVPTMEAVAVCMARGLEIQLGADVGRIRRRSGRWYLSGRNDAPLDDAGFDAVVLAMPSTACLELIRDQSELAPRVSSVFWGGSRGKAASRRERARQARWKAGSCTRTRHGPVPTGRWPSPRPRAGCRGPSPPGLVARCCSARLPRTSGVGRCRSIRSRSRSFSMSTRRSD
jgi:NAD(P)-binding Rossmann-like domain